MRCSNREASLRSYKPSGRCGASAVAYVDGLIREGRRVWVVAVLSSFTQEVLLSGPPGSKMLPRANKRIRTQYPLIKRKVRDSRHNLHCG